ncbi:MAG TPA: hypothetical protein VF168_07130 [Trueperaceae bacterium]
MTKKLTLWLTGALAVLILAACGQTPGPVDPDPAGTSTLAITVNGNGSVTGDAGGLACTAAGGETCAASVDDGTTVTLTATPDEGETFEGWGGACEGVEATCTVTVNDDTTVVANFSGAPVGGDGNTFVIAASNNDAEELDNPSSGNATDFPAGFTYTDSSDLDLVFDPSHGTTQDVGLRFTGVSIPAGATVESAFIVFTADADDPGNDSPVTVTIHGEADANASSFANDPDGAPSGDISGRATTSAQVDWQINEAWAAGAEVQSADVSAIVQEIVDMEGWAAGNAMAFIITGADSTNYRTAQSFDGGAAPVLHITLADDAADGGTGDGGAGDGTGGGATE